MARSTKIVTPQRARKATSISLVRAFPETQSAAGSGANPAPLSATARVRDGLVLRLVGKKKSTARSVPDERRPR
jgi:hypothetical protein